MSGSRASSLQDADRLVEQRSLLEGEVATFDLPRLADLLAAGNDGIEVPPIQYRLSFDREPGLPRLVTVSINAKLPLLCQRSLASFVLPLQIERRLALVRSEADEASLPDGLEAVYLDEEGRIDPLELVEDELILAVPDVPVDPALGPAEEFVWRDLSPDDEPEKLHPFAALADLKKSQH